MQPNEIIIERQFVIFDRGRCVEDVIDRPENVRAYIIGMDKGAFLVS